MVHGKNDTRVRSIEFVFLIGGGRTVSRYTDVSGFREFCSCPAALASLGTALRVMIGVCDSRDAFSRLMNVACQRLVNPRVHTRPHVDPSKSVEKL